MTAASRAKARGDAIAEGEYLFTEDDFSFIASALYSDAGIHLVRSKAMLVYSRLAKRVRALRLPDFAAYCALIDREDGQAERQEMLRALTTNVTRFFREGHHFNHLTANIAPRLTEAAKRGERVRIWSSACSSGQEPYSIAMALLDASPALADADFRILATDIDSDMVAKATAGVYPRDALSTTDASLVKKFFTQTSRGSDTLRANDELRKVISFRALNLNGDWPMKGKFDVIFCRNVVIYFDEPTQQKLWSRFASILKPQGWLYVGHSERVTGSADALFESQGATIYNRK
ncbi:MAG: protein-glutamate O-methyltransferase CheR [Pseudomonadota bacterium]